MEEYRDDMMEEFLDSEGVGSVRRGMIVSGRIVAISDQDVFVDIGYKAEGVLPIDEFDDRPSVGEEVEVVVKRFLPDGTVLLSKRDLELKKRLEEIESAKELNQNVFGVIKERVKGGYRVDLGGYSAFLPMSLADLVRVEDPDSLVGIQSGFKVVDVKRGQREVNIVVSRKDYLKELEEKERELFWERIVEGKVLEGTVKKIVPYGAFINLGPVDALLHKKDISWKKVDDVSSYLKEGSRVWVKVLSVDKDAKKVTVGMKQLTPDPWEELGGKLKVGDKVRGVVIEVFNKGAVIEIEEGVEAFLPASELFWTKRVKDVREVLKVGDQVEVVVLELDPAKRRMVVSLRRMVENPWESVGKRYPVGSIVEATVRSVQPNRVIVELDEDIRGYLFPEDIFWSRRGKSVRDVVKEGDKIKVKVLEVIPEKRFIKVGLKQVLPDPWEEFVSSHKVGDVVKGKVVGITNFGAFVEVADQVEGLVHISHISKSKPSKVEDVVKVGDEVNAVIISIDKDNRKLSLSIKEYEMMKEKEELEAVRKKENDTGLTLGDILKKVIDNK